MNENVTNEDGPKSRNRIVAFVDILGASLLAPGVVYPDHDHPPEEIYLVLSAGVWFNHQRGWYTPGAGGTVHHAKGSTHEPGDP